MASQETVLPSPLDKPLHQLTEEDISQLTREDCRRYLKSKGMRRPSWNKSQAIQQVISLKTLLEATHDSDASAARKKLHIPRLDTSYIAPKPASGNSPSSPSSAEETVLYQAKDSEKSDHLPDDVLACHVAASDTNDSIPPRLFVAPILQFFTILVCFCTYSEIIHSNFIWLTGEHAFALSYPMSTESYMGVTQQNDVNAHSASTFGYHETDIIHLVDNYFLLTVLLSERLSFSCTNWYLKTEALQNGYRISEAANVPAGQLTIFYCGKVNVYDDVPADKARFLKQLVASPLHLPLEGPFDGAAARQTLPGIFHLSSVKSGVDPPVPTLISMNLTDNSRLHREEIDTNLEDNFATEGPANIKLSVQRYLEKRKDRFKRKIAPSSSASMDVYLNHQTGYQTSSYHAIRSNTCSPTQIRSHEMSDFCEINAINDPKLSPALSDKGKQISRSCLM
ncbi:protein TIFY 4A-like [Impatiens glandulifera]|uniref:protein TIFY 4A-like n=1 Tax=Impatiens glandulifera TaxID=253017 RepID=UPI001FB131AF|nr:protein TIFY 4A-like [Impatiens glandulifera]